MSRNNNHNHSSPSCAYAEELISYLYGEADAGEKIKFEAHLPNCAPCADELASFGLVRSAVLDWRAQDFSKLETPLIEIPARQSNSSFAPAVAAEESNSWFGGLRKLFSLNPATAAAFAVLVIGAGLAFYLFGFSGESEIANRNADKNLATAIASPPVEIKKQSEITDDKIAAPVVEIKTPDSKAEKSNAPSQPVVKVSTVEPKNNNNSRARVVKESNGDARKTSPVRKQPIPNLNDADEEEDETLRLADLFAELDTKE